MTKAKQEIRVAADGFPSFVRFNLAIEACTVQEMASWGSNKQESLPPAYGRQGSWSATDGWSQGGAAPPPPISPMAGYTIDTDTGAVLTNAQPTPGRPRAGTQASGFAEAPAVEGEEWELAPLERVQVALKGDMQGWAFVKHHVWTVIHPEKGTSVDRRYSDFVWLVDSLTKRYPFRLLPALPPKRIQVSGHYLATDDLFLERRRRGLERALTALLAHPVLKRDALLNAFMTEQRDLAEYRKSQEISLAEESASRSLTPAELASLPTDLESRLTSVRQRVIPLVESWTRITSTADRIAHRRQNQGREFASFQEALEGAVETAQGAWRPNEVGQSERHLRSVAGLAGEVGETDETSARRSLDTVVESLKRHREIFVNLRDLFGRQVALGGDQVDKIRKRLDSNTAKLAHLREATPRPPSFEVDAEKLTSLMENDQRLIETALKRREFIKFCLWEEVRWAWRSTSRISKVLRDYAADEAAYGRRIGEQWSALADALGGVPLI
ncbi:hypothetical protein JCM10908_004698 [Rhodotorula pacifica]|uniref:Mvp1p n=1 Tax=Rhodotorula pacifica TaxID=1495444 RepID=UPI00317EA0F3